MTKEENSSVTILKIFLIENKYGIKNKPASPDNPQANAIIEIIHQVLGNLAHTYNIQETYIDDADQWMGILAAVAFAELSIYHSTKRKIPGQLVLGRDMILPINHVSDWRYIRQRKQAKIDNSVTRVNANRIDHNYRVGGNVMIRTKSAFE